MVCINALGFHHFPVTASASWKSERVSVPYKPAPFTHKGSLSQYCLQCFDTVIRRASWNWMKRCSCGYLSGTKCKWTI